jgi:asparagine synthase (glutamine-hydrolysing)
MCGIFMMLNNALGNEGGIFSKDFILDQFNRNNRRGPESSKLMHLSDNCSVGFHRLAINGLNEASMQPIVFNNKMLICNGEIYNYQDLYRQLNSTPTTESDCEVILHLYCRYGIEQTVRMLDGVFAFAIYDMDLQQIIVGRDPYGVRPLYMWRGPNFMFMFASEMKLINKFHQNVINNAIDASDEEIQKGNIAITHFLPGHYMVIHLHKYFRTWLHNEMIKYHEVGSISSFCPASSVNENIVNHLRSAVRKRCLATERPIACLLSGGLDSSLVTALVSEFYDKYCPDKVLETYSIGLADSVDLKYARIVANHVRSKHTEITITEDDFFNAIPEVIEAIESYDTTTVRASIGNYLVGKYISQHSTAKVIFNGDGADELCGGYLYMHKAPDSIEFDKETKRLLKDIHLFDVLRSDKCISSHGLEPRTPFLDKTFVQYYLSLPTTLRCHSLWGEPEKYLLRNAFATVDNLLPAEILWRTKEAFSDGVSGHGRSLYTILQEKIAAIDGIEEDYANFTSKEHLQPKTLEQYYYRRIFDSIFPTTAKILPYFWMPKYTNSNDPSARTLTTLYNSKMGGIKHS